MGKRSEFDRIPRDYYPTPLKAVLPLLPHLQPTTRFIEPCAGDGRLVNHLTAYGHQCVHAYDIAPQSKEVALGDLLQTTRSDVADAEVLITNPPWDRAVLHPMLVHIRTLGIPAWLLFDADWIHTVQSAAYLSNLKKIVSIGRVKWIEDSKMTGKDNCCWYLFGPTGSNIIELHGRTK